MKITTVNQFEVIGTENAENVQRIVVENAGKKLHRRHGTGFVAEWLERSPQKLVDRG